VNRLRRGFLCACVAFLLLFGACVTARASPPAPRVITTHPVDAVAVHGDSVLYHDEQTREIILFDLNAWTGRTLVTDVTASTVALSDEYIAYATRPELRDGPATLFLQPLSGGGEAITVATAVQFMDATIAGGWLYWSQKREAWHQEAAYGYRLDTGPAEPLAIPSSMQGFRTFAFDGRRFAWLNSGSIWAREMDTGQTYRLGAHSPRSVTAVSGENVLFVNSIALGGPCDGEWLNLFRPETGEELFFVSRGMCLGPDAGQPALRGTRLALVAEARSQVIDVYDTRERTSPPLRLAADGIPKGDVYLSERYVVYQTEHAEGDSSGLSALGPLSPVATARLSPSRLTLPDSVRLARPDPVPPASFSDLPRDHWAAGAVDLTAAAGLVNGYPDGTFRPSALISRAEYLSILVRAYPPQPGPEAEPFADVPPEHWAYSLIMAARSAGLVTGYADNRFLPEAPISRAEVAVLMQRVLRLPLPFVPVRFPDLPVHWRWARPSVEALAAHDVLTGYPDGTFQAAGPATRAEVSALFSRLFR